MNATAKTIRHLKKFRDLDSAIASLEARVRASKKARIPKPAPPGKDRDARRAEHRASTGELRREVWQRAGGTIGMDIDTSEWLLEGVGRCEVSGAELGAAWEMHHLDAAGHRRSHQSLDNVLAVSWEVHRLIHRGDMPTLRSVKEACIRLGLREGLRAIEHRIAKVEEARR